jgi:hypothetical protein
MTLFRFIILFSSQEGYSTLQGHKTESGIALFLKERKKKVSPRSRKLLFPETAHLYRDLC